MRKEAFKVMYNIEDSWWYKGRSSIVNRVLDFYIKDKNQNILDFGSGFGGMIGVLSKYGKVSATELELTAMENCKKRGYIQTFSNKNDALLNNNYSLIGMFDVLEHIEDDGKILQEIYNNLKSNGSILITVPAYPFLWGKHDLDHHHYRRYTKSSIKEILTKTGFKVKYLSYWNVTLFLPIAILRVFGVSGGESLGKPSFFDKIFNVVVHTETKFIPKISFPFGTGLIIFATKN